MGGNKIPLQVLGCNDDRGETDLNRLHFQGLTAPRRKLHRAHFAFMRSYVQGIDLRESWDRYLNIEGSGTDQRIVRKTVAWLRDEFAAAARRHDRHGTARLVRFDPNKIVQSELKLLTLEAFSFERGLEDFPYEEQIEAYQAEFGCDTARPNRRARVIRRQLDALHRLEKLAAEEPHPDDSVVAWLHPDLASRLELENLYTLRQLAERINGVGYGWHAPVRAIGAGKAARIVEWMIANESCTKLFISPHACSKSNRTGGLTIPFLPNTSGIVPFERLVVPSELDGSAGQFRAPHYQCMINAKTDHQAVLAFVRSKRGLTHAEAVALNQTTAGSDGDPFAWRKGLSNTQSAYLIELERFTIWAIVKRRKALSSLMFDDCIAYREFIANPTPAEQWCGSRRRRIGPAWRPFAGPLGPSAQTRTLTVLNAFYRFLCDKRYMTGNPMSGVVKPKQPRKESVLERVLTLGEWKLVNDALKALPSTSANLRLRFAVRWLYSTGLRRQELLKAKLGDLKFVALQGSPGSAAVSGWELKVIGKGGVERDVAIPDALIRELSAYLLSRGLDPNPLAPENRQVALIGQAVDIGTRAPWSHEAAKPIDPRRPIGAHTFYDQLKSFFRTLSKALTHADPAAAEVFQQASTHWLRHTRISHSLAAGTDLRVEMKNAGHKSAETTALYTHIEARERIVGNAKFFNTLDSEEAA
jgi:site-specific recombinase XerD